MEAADVAHQRAVERIEMSKDMEFQYKEQERLRKLSANAARRAAYDKVIESGEHTADEPAMRQLDSEIETERVWIETGFRSPSRKEDPFAAALRGLLPGGAEGAATGGAGGGTPAPGGATPATAGQVQTIVNDKTGERMVSKNGGNTWEPIETPLYKDPSFYLSPFSLAKKALTARPFEKGFKHTNAPFRSK
ncbi:MAG: hypothetical protein GY938_30595 [Ketobacter sp.]|nr:hypothetical protein [Ketobacter sp.]